ncbi:hypothetical protein L0Z65_02360 [Phaeobacter sp. BS52]|uniref:hypothetical protein n=1 Tax=Phaeobacter sp. BS52 TaxID=2907241 RepID=UPI0038680C1D
MVDMRDDGEIADVSEVCHARGYDLVLGFGQDWMIAQGNIMLPDNIQEFLDCEMPTQDASLIRLLGWRMAMRVWPRIFSASANDVDRLRIEDFRLQATRAALLATYNAYHSIGEHKTKRGFRARSPERELETVDSSYRSILLSCTQFAKSRGRRQPALARLEDILDSVSAFVEDDELLIFLRAEEILVRDGIAEDMPPTSNLTPMFTGSKDGWEILRNMAQAPNSPWVFWREWYQGFLDGKPLDWELQRRIALINGATWDAGPEAVAAEIDRIRSRYELEQEIANLKKQLAIVQDTPAASLIGDNGGPPLEDAPARAFQTDLALIWKQVEKLEEEIAKPSPSPSHLEKIAEVLWDISRRLAAYCGSVADGMIREGSKELAKAGAKWTAGATAVTVTAQTESVQSVAKAIWAFVKTLPPG